MKKLLITATDLMLVQFLLPHVRNLSEKGWDIRLACSEVGGRLAEVREALPGITVKKIDLGRSPFRLKNLRGFRELKALLKGERFDLIWTNEPVMGAVTRLAARGSGAKVLYLCHGFHFFRGGPVQNWLYYPIERALSRETDLLVTINREDFHLSQNMPARRTACIHGIGVVPKWGDRTVLRQELGLKSSDFLVLCVGELNKNKDQVTLLQALAKCPDRRVHLALCGKGAKEAALRRLAAALNLTDRVHFLGYRRDMGNVYAGADLLAHPSRREGLGLAVLEGMLAGLPAVACDIRGIRDYGETLLPPGDGAAFAAAIQNPPPAVNPAKLAPYLLENVKIEIERLLDSL